MKNVVLAKYWDGFLRWKFWNIAWQAIFAIFSLQAGLLRTFGTGERWEHLLNLAVGCLVCLLTVAMGIYMIRRANREIKKLQEINYG